jgi:hypothetical protein
MNKLKTILLLGILTIVVGLISWGMENEPSYQTAQAFWSPIRPPTPAASPTPGPGPSPTPPACPPGVQWKSFEAHVKLEGLSKGERVLLRVRPANDRAAACLKEHRVTLPETALGNGRLYFQLPKIPDGAYFKMEIQASSGYFRNPAGYLFQVKDGQITKHPENIFYFRIEPPSEHRLPPCPQQHIHPTSSGTQLETSVVCRAEPFIDLSAPSKQPASQESKLDAFRSNYIYRYVGPQTTQDNQGVLGRRYVVDTSIDHHIWPWNRQTVTEYSYARSYPDTPGGSDWRWMEAGWSEVSWRDDKQYVYQYDSNTRQWHFFDQFVLETGSPVETKVEYRPDKNTWWALFHLSGNEWSVLAEEDLGFSIADSSYNWGEIYLENDNSPTPILPLSRFDIGELKINNRWRLWNDDFFTQTIVDEYPPYQVDMIERFHQFNIHSPVIFLPFIQD